MSELYEFPSKMRSALFAFARTTEQVQECLQYKDCNDYAMRELFRLKVQDFKFFLSKTYTTMFDDAEFYNQRKALTMFFARTMEIICEVPSILDKILSDTVDTLIASNVKQLAESGLMGEIKVVEDVVYKSGSMIFVKTQKALDAALQNPTLLAEKNYIPTVEVILPSSRGRSKDGYSRYSSPYSRKLDSLVYRNRDRAGKSQFDPYPTTKDVPQEYSPRSASAAGDNSDCNSRASSKSSKRSKGKSVKKGKKLTLKKGKSRKNLKKGASKRNLYNGFSRGSSKRGLRRGLSRGSSFSNRSSQSSRSGSSMSSSRSRSSRQSVGNVWSGLNAANHLTSRARSRRASQSSVDKPAKTAGRKTVTLSPIQGQRKKVKAPRRAVATGGLGVENRSKGVSECDGESVGSLDKPVNKLSVTRITKTRRDASNAPNQQQKAPKGLNRSMKKNGTEQVLVTTRSKKSPIRTNRRQATDIDDSSSDSSPEQSIGHQRNRRVRPSAKCLPTKSRTLTSPVSRPKGTPASKEGETDVASLNGARKIPQSKLQKLSPSRPRNASPSRLEHGKDKAKISVPVESKPIIRSVKPPTSQVPSKKTENNIVSNDAVGGQKDTSDLTVIKPVMNQTDCTVPRTAPSSIPSFEKSLLALPLKNMGSDATPVSISSVSPITTKKSDQRETASVITNNVDSSSQSTRKLVRSVSNKGPARKNTKGVLKRATTNQDSSVQLKPLENSNVKSSARSGRSASSARDSSSAAGLTFASAVKDLAKYGYVYDAGNDAFLSKISHEYSTTKKVTSDLDKKLFPTLSVSFY